MVLPVVGETLVGPILLSNNIGGIASRDGFRIVELLVGTPNLGIEDNCASHRGECQLVPTSAHLHLRFHRLCYCSHGKHY